MPRIQIHLWRYRRDKDGNLIRDRSNAKEYLKEHYPGCPSSMSASTHCERLWYEKMQDDSLKRADTMNSLLKQLVGLIEDHTDDDDSSDEAA